MKPQKYDEKCDVKTLFLLTPTHKEKLLKISEYEEKPFAEILRNFIENRYDDIYGNRNIQK